MRCDARVTIGIAARRDRRRYAGAGHRWTSPDSGRLSITRTRSSGSPVPNWATTPACHSARRAGFAPTPGTRIASRSSRSISAVRTRPTTRFAVSPRCASGPTTTRHAAHRRVPYPHRRVREQADDLSRRPAASARLRAAHVSGFLDRRVGRQHADRSRPRTSRRTTCGATVSAQRRRPA